MRQVFLYFIIFETHVPSPHANATILKVVLNIQYPSTVTLKLGGNFFDKEWLHSICIFLFIYPCEAYRRQAASGQLTAR